jgi:Ca-activated chloride channel family protein
MTFGSPLWLWALLLLPLLAFFFARAEQRGAEKLQLFVAARLLPQLAGTVNRARRTFRFILLLLVLGLVIISLARPRWGYAYDEVKRKGLDLLLAVDVSRSMLSNDVQPNRLERVKLATQDLINELQGDRVGLIAFAGRAFLQAPLTIDYDAAVDSINELDTKIIPEGGTNISDAIALATRTFGKSAIGNRALIIFTDGEELSGDAVQAAKVAADAGVRIFTIGVGTPGGSLIPIQSENGGTAFVKDAKGEVVKSKLDETRLREIAQAADGFYLHLENGPRTMKQLFDEGLGKMKVADINARLSRRPIERYEWPLAAAILLFALALLINDRRRRRPATGALPPPEQKQGRKSGRPSTAIAAAIFLLFVRQSFGASAGLELYEQQKFPEAYEHFQKALQENPGARQSDRIEFDAGAAAYKMKDYNKALQSFSQALLSKNPHLQSESHYNLGNTLYQRGEAEKSDAKKLTNWEGALQHYQETLKAEPQNKNAKDNYEFVKKKIEELKKKQEQKPTPTPTPTPTPSPSPSPSPQKDQNKDQQKNDKDQQQQKNDQQQKDQQQQSQGGQGSGQDQKPQDGEQSPSPSPTPRPMESPTPTATGSPSPSPNEDGEASPSPSPGSEETPSPTPGSGEQNGNENGQQPTPTPAGTPNKPLTGEVKGAGEEKPKSEQQAQAAEVEPEKEGEMSPKQAALLLEAMKDEEEKVQLDEHKPVRPVYNDW